jgi:WD40 repeat protein
MIANLNFSPDGELLAWVSALNAPLHIWDVRNARPYPFPPLLVWYAPLSVAFYQDSRHVAFISHARVPEVWDVVTRQKVYPSGPDDVRGARDSQLSAVIALSRDDAWLAASTHGLGAVTVWDMQRGQLLLALPEERSEVQNLAWSPNRALLAASYSDGSLVLWNVPRIRAQLAEIGLDWQDAPPPAPRPKPAPDPGVEAARLFSLDRYGTTRATLATEGNVCRVEVTAVDGTAYHSATLTQLFDNLQLQEGASYTIRFEARADAPRPIVLTTTASFPDVHAIGLRDEVINLTEKWKPCQYEFRAKNLADWNGIHIIVGKQTGTVWIKDFAIEGAK